MDPVTLIVCGVGGVCVGGAQNLAADAMKDAYAGLKALVRRRLVGRPAEEVALELPAQKLEQRDTPLEAELVEADAGGDAEAVSAAQRLLDAAGSQSGKYLVDLPGAQGVQVGDRNTQRNTWRSSTLSA